jgi:SOS-response transcriptional repressor LexA
VNTLDYKSLLRKYIEKSGLSLSVIETRMKERGLSTNKAYISKLQTGKRPPAGDEINTALAELTGGDPEKLNWYAYVEKAPAIVKESLSIMGDDVINAASGLRKKYPEFFEGEDVSESIKETNEYRQFVEKLEVNIKEHLRNGTNTLLNERAAQELEEMIADTEIPEEIKAQIIETCRTEGYEQAYTLIKEKTEELEEENNRLQVYADNYSHSAELGIQLKEENKELLLKVRIINPKDTDNVFANIITPPNISEEQSRDLMMLIVSDNAMKNSRISLGDRVIFEYGAEYRHNDLVVVYVQTENKFTVRRVKEVNNSILLVADNEKFELYTLSDKVGVTGVVRQVIFET